MLPLNEGGGGEGGGEGEGEKGRGEKGRREGGEGEREGERGGRGGPPEGKRGVWQLIICRYPHTESDTPCNSSLQENTLHCTCTTYIPSTCPHVYNFVPCT